MYFPGITLANVLSVDGRWTQMKQLSDGAVRGMAVPLGIGVAVHEIWMFFFFFFMLSLLFVSGEWARLYTVDTSKHKKTVAPGL